MKARMYLPAYGRFAQPDPVYDHSEDGLNLYSYCSNQPVTRTDPDGLRDTSVGGSAGGHVPHELNFLPEWAQRIAEAEQTGGYLRLAFGYGYEGRQMDGFGHAYGEITAAQAAQTGQTNGSEVQATNTGTNVPELEDGKIDGNDRLVGDPNGLTASKELFKLAGYGFAQTERGVWIIFDENGKFVKMINWPWSASNNKQSIPSDFPPGDVDMGHTHPRNRTQQPSFPQDINAATERGMNGYVFSRTGIYRIDRLTGQVVAVAGRDWFK